MNEQLKLPGVGEHLFEVEEADRLDTVRNNFMEALSGVTSERSGTALFFCSSTDVRAIGGNFFIETLKNASVAGGLVERLPRQGGEQNAIFLLSNLSHYGDAEAAFTRLENDLRPMVANWTVEWHELLYDGQRYYRDEAGALVTAA